MFHTFANRLARICTASMATPLLKNWRYVSTGAVVAFVAVVSIAAQPVKQRTDAQHVVVIKQMHFSPQQITARVGETVEWKNEDIFSHTVTADDRSFDSGLIAPGHSWRLKVQKVGEIGYHCRPHPNMTAKLIAQAPGKNTKHAPPH